MKFFAVAAFVMIVTINLSKIKKTEQEKQSNIFKIAPAASTILGGLLGGGPLGEAVGGLTGAAGGALTGVATLLSPIIDNITKILTGLLSFIVDVVHGIASSLDHPGAIKTINDLVSNALGAIKTLLAGPTGDATPFVNEAVQTETVFGGAVKA